MESLQNEFIADADIKNNEALFNRMLEKLPAAAFTLDSEGLITYFNPAAEKLLGRSPLLNDPVDKFLGSFNFFNSEGSQIKNDQTWMAKALRVEIDFTEHEVIIEQPEGPGIHALVNANAIHDESGNLRGLVNILVDITYKKRIEEEKLKLEMQHMHSQKLESLGVLAGGIAHDFNNLLTVIQGNADLALMFTGADDKAYTFLKNIEISTSKAADLTKQMLAYSGKGQFIVEVIELEKLILDSTALLKTVISKKVKLSFNLNPASIIGDKTEIRQLIMNLVTNAAEAMGSKSGSIAIETGTKQMSQEELFSPQFPDEKQAGNYAYLKVSDSGFGMNYKTLSKIFDPFFSTKFTGRGLGLAATMGIVKGHQGVIKVDSTIYEGSTFEVLIPSQKASQKDEELSKVENSNGKEQLSVLVVDDEADVLNFIEAAFKASDIKVYSATTGSEALQIFKTKRDISVAVLDITMDQMDGFELLEKLRLIQADLAALFMSGYSESEVFSEVAAIENTSFIQKPMSISSLISSVKKLFPAAVRCPL